MVRVIEPARMWAERMLSLEDQDPSVGVNIPPIAVIRQSDPDHDSPESTAKLVWKALKAYAIEMSAYYPCCFLREVRRNQKPKASQKNCPLNCREYGFRTHRRNLAKHSTRCTSWFPIEIALCSWVLKEPVWILE